MARAYSNISDKNYDLSSLQDAYSVVTKSDLYNNDLTVQIICLGLDDEVDIIFTQGHDTDINNSSPIESGLSFDPIIISVTNGSDFVIINTFFAEYGFVRIDSKNATRGSVKLKVKCK